MMPTKSSSVPVTISRGRSVLNAIVRWTARVLSVPVILAVGFELAEGVSGGHIQADALSIFVLVLLLAILGGLILGWWREGLGGLVTLGAMLLFALAFRIEKGAFPPVLSAMLLMPPCLFLLARLLNGPRHRRLKKCEPVDAGDAETRNAEGESLSGSRKHGTSEARNPERKLS